MPIKTACPGCNKTYKVDEKYLGKRVKCPGCGVGFEVKQEEEVLVPYKEPPVSLRPPSSAGSVGDGATVRGKTGMSTVGQSAGEGSTVDGEAASADGTQATPDDLPFSPVAQKYELQRELAPVGWAWCTWLGTKPLGGRW